MCCGRGTYRDGSARREEVTKRCRQSWLTNSALVYEPKCGGGGCGVSANEYSWAHGTQNKIWRSTVTPYLTYSRRAKSGLIASYHVRHLIHFTTELNSVLAKLSIFTYLYYTYSFRCDYYSTIPY
jgi:hypothetical protein